MKKFKKLLMVQMLAYLLVIVCMLLFYMGHGSSTLRIIMFVLLIFAFNFNAFLIYYYLKHGKESKK